ncbi:monocarboxylate transporter 12-like [Antedon mediterranea]|uniref:monocarboxylate transporter 12-like n=1 Tax=Antedon mediterranea TaxID=105859 RepID=UPI003AF501CE
MACVCSCREVLLLAGMHIIALTSIGSAIPCFSFFLVSIKDEFNTTSGLVGIANSLSIGLTALLGPLASTMSRKYGYRSTVVIGGLSYSLGMMISSQVTQVWHLFFSHSLMTGAGVCICFQTMVIYVNLNYKRSVSIANGVLFAAIGLGILIIPLACSVLKMYYGWRGSLLIMGAVSLHSVVIATLIFRKDFYPMSEDDKKCSIDVITNNEDRDTILHNLRLFKKYPRLILMTVATCFICVGYSGFYVHLIASAIYKGVTDFQASIIFGAFGIGNLAGRVANAIPLYFGWISEYNLFIFCMFVITCTMSAVAVSQSFPSLLTFSLITGLFFGIYIPQIPAIVKEFVPKRVFARAYGISLVPSGFTAIFGGYIVGALYDKIGNYKISFFFAAANYLIVGIMLTIAEIITKLRGKTQKISEEEDSDKETHV